MSLFLQPTCHTSLGCLPSWLLRTALFGNHLWDPSILAIVSGLCFNQWLQHCFLVLGIKYLLTHF